MHRNIQSDHFYVKTTNTKWRYTKNNLSCKCQRESTAFVHFDIWRSALDFCLAEPLHNCCLISRLSALFTQFSRHYTYCFGGFPLTTGLTPTPVVRFVSLVFPLGRERRLQRQCLAGTRATRRVDFGGVIRPEWDGLRGCRRGGVRRKRIKDSTWADESIRLRLKRCRQVGVERRVSLIRRQAGSVN